MVSAVHRGTSARGDGTNRVPTTTERSRVTAVAGPKMTGDPASLRAAFGCVPSGVSALCAMHGQTPIGLVASSFTSVSLEPPLVSVCLARTSTTWPRLRSAPRIGVSILAEGQDKIGRALAARSDNRFDGVEWQAAEGGAVLVGGAALWLECRVVDEVAAGDHEIVILALETLTAFPEVAPLVFHSSRFRRLAP